MKQKNDSDLGIDGRYIEFTDIFINMSIIDIYQYLNFEAPDLI